MLSWVFIDLKKAIHKYTRNEVEDRGSWEVVAVAIIIVVVFVVVVAVDAVVVVVRNYRELQLNIRV